jgi:hypothetical protein
MRDVDRVVLRNVVIVAVASTASLVLVGTTCLGRSLPRLEAADGRDASRTSAGGLPVGSATIAAGTLERTAPQPPPPSTAEPAPPSSFNVPQLPPGFRGMPGQMPMPMPMPQATQATPYPSASPSAMPPTAPPPLPTMPPPIFVQPTPLPPGFAMPPGFMPPQELTAPAPPGSAQPR